MLVALYALTDDVTYVNARKCLKTLRRFYNLKPYIAVVPEDCTSPTRTVVEETGSVTT